MNKKTIILFIVLFALLVLGMLIFGYLEKTKTAQNSIPPVSTSTDTAPQEEPDPYANTTRITGTHFFSDGTHTIVGEVDLPTPCDLLEVNAEVQESAPEQVTLQFSVLNEAEMCAQVITIQRYRLDVSADSEATFTATLNGRPVELNLVPGDPSEDPDDFELYIKG